MNEKIRHLREKLKALNVDGMIVSKPASIKYLTNIEMDGLLLITRKENIFLTYSMYIEMVKATVTITVNETVYSVTANYNADNGYYNVTIVRGEAESEITVYGTHVYIDLYANTEDVTSIKVESNVDTEFSLYSKQ